MNNPTNPNENESQHVTNSDNPSLVVEYMDGRRRQGWRMALMNEWELKTGVMVETDKGLKQFERLTIEIGTRLVRVYGRNLNQVERLLAQGAGAVLREVGLEYVELAKKGEPYIGRILVEDFLGEHPKEGLGGDVTEIEDTVMTAD